MNWTPTGFVPMDLDDDDDDDDNDDDDDDDDDMLLQLETYLTVCPIRCIWKCKYLPLPNFQCL